MFFFVVEESHRGVGGLERRLAVKIHVVIWGRLC
jgi:hypothetical protein